MAIYFRFLSFLTSFEGLLISAHVVFLGFRDKPRMYYSLAGLLYRSIWTFQVRPPDASTPADASRTPVAEVETLWAGK
jgi:hypothetical protein